MIEQYTLILKHEAVMGDGEKIQLDPPLVLSHIFDRSLVGSPVVLDEMMHRFTQEVMKRAAEWEGKNDAETD